MAWAAISAPIDTQRSDGNIKSYAMEDNVKIYKGAIVVLKAGYARPATDAAGEYFAGIAYETMDNTETGHATGAKKIRVFKKGVFSLGNGDVVAADVGKPAYLDLTATGNDAKVAKTSNQTGPTNMIKVGMIDEYVSATEVRVSIDNAIGYISQTKA